MSGMVKLSKSGISAAKPVAPNKRYKTLLGNSGRRTLRQAGVNTVIPQPQFIDLCLQKRSCGKAALLQRNAADAG